MTITVDVWQMSDLESESRTQTVAPDGTIAGHSFWTEDIIAFATAKATIRSGAGTVLAVSPEVSIGCPPGNRTLNGARQGRHLPRTVGVSGSYDATWPQTVGDARLVSRAAVTAGPRRGRGRR